MTEDRCECYSRAVSWWGGQNVSNWLSSVRELVACLIGNVLCATHAHTHRTIYTVCQQLWMRRVNSSKRADVSSNKENLNTLQSTEELSLLTALHCWVTEEAWNRHQLRDELSVTVSSQTAHYVCCWPVNKQGHFVNAILYSTNSWQSF